MTAILSLEQAPPLSVPLRFFLSVPLFGMLAAGLLLWAGDAALASRWSGITLALTHLLVLGVLGMAMLGAMFQMLPVLAGVRVLRPVLVGGLCHALLLPGTLLLTAGFLGAGRMAFVGAVLLLGGGFVLFLAVIGAGLLRTPHPADGVRGMRWTVLALGLTVALGVLLGLGHASLGVPLWRGAAADLHLAWGLLGWVALLVAVVAWQVVPMFQMTPPYPSVLRRWLAPVTVGLLGAWSLLRLLGWPGQALLLVLLAVCVATTAVTTLRLLGQRRRKVMDASLPYWRLGMGALLLAAVTALLGEWVVLPGGLLPPLLPAVLFIAGFALSVMSGMLGKIVPFLVWLHLQQRIAALPAGAGRLPPNMKAILPDAAVRRHFRCHSLALAMLLAGLWWPLLLRPAGALWLLAFVLLAVNLLAATVRYRAECRPIDAA